MKRKVADLEQKLINNGWCLTIKRYTGKHSEKTHCYEYHKTSDITNNGKSYEQVIQLDQKRSQIVNYGIANIQIDYLDREELDLIRFLFLELRHFVERTEKEIFYSTEIDPPRYIGNSVNVPNSELEQNQENRPMTFEELDELCQDLGIDERGIKMTRDEFVKDLELKATTTTHIKERAQKLFDKLEPILNEEDKRTAKECLVDYDFPKENEVCIKWFVPQEWLLNEQFQQMLWEWYCMCGGKNNESNTNKH